MGRKSRVKKQRKAQEDTLSFLNSSTMSIFSYDREFLQEKFLELQDDICPCCKSSIYHMLNSPNWRSSPFSDVKQDDKALQHFANLIFDSTLKD